MLFSKSAVNVAGQPIGHFELAQYLKKVQIRPKNHHKTVFKAVLKIEVITIFNANAASLNKC